ARQSGNSAAGRPRRRFHGPPLPGEKRDMLTLRARSLVLSTCFVSLTALDAASAPEPTFADVSYGPHKPQMLDFWQAKTERPAPLLVFIHGGGFVGGDKAKIRDKRVIDECLKSSICGL